MVRFFRTYPDPAAISPQPVAKLPAARETSRTKPISPQAVAESQQLAPTNALLWMVPWSHHVILLEKVKDHSHRLWYMQQSRLVERIDALATKIEEAKELSATIELEQKALRKTVITSLIEQEPYSGRLGEVLLSPPRNGWSARCDNLDSGTAILSLGAITGFWYRPDHIKRTSLPTKADAHYWLKPGDLLISRSNTPELVGHAAIYDGNPSPCIYPDLMMLLNVNTERYDPRFVHYVLQTRQVRDFIRTNAKGTSPTMKKISQGVVATIPFPTSVPREKQQRLVKKLDDLREKLDQASRLQTNAHDELNAMLPAIIDRAFKGEL